MPCSARVQVPFRGILHTLCRSKCSYGKMTKNQAKIISSNFVAYIKQIHNGGLVSLIVVPLCLAVFWMPLKRLM